MFNPKVAFTINRPQWNNKEEDNRVVCAKKYPIEKMYEGILKQTVKVLMCCCPFHKEDTPSFAIYPENNTWYCFACSTGGDAINFYMQKTGYNFVQAIEELNK